MSGYFGITDAIRKSFSQTERVQTITHGDLNMIDLNRQSIYPLVHVVCSGATFNERTTDYIMSVTVMDLVDFTRDDVRDESEPFYGTDNTQDVLHDLALTVEQALDKLRRGDIRNDLIELIGNSNGTAFINDSEEVVAGWNLTLNLSTLNASVTDGYC